MRYAFIFGGAVVNVAVSDADQVAEVAGRNIPIALPDDSPVGVGWLWEGGEFLPPMEQAPAPELRHITVGAFFDRFGAAKWGIMADPAPAVQAVVRDASVRRHIDLDNPDLPAGLAIVQAAGHAIDPQAIIGAPVQPQERP